MPTLVIELDHLFQSLQQARGQRKVAAAQRFCQAAIRSQRRGELGLLPAASMVEAALQHPELQAHEPVLRILEQACLVQSPLRVVAHDPASDWRELVKRVEQWAA